MQQKQKSALPPVILPILEMEMPSLSKMRRSPLSKRLVPMVARMPNLLCKRSGLAMDNRVEVILKNLILKSNYLRLI